MTADRTARPSQRDPLTRESVVRAAVALADTAGAGVPSMRRLAEGLGVKAMALYHHFRNKDELLDGMIDRVFAEIELPPRDLDWEVAMRQRAVATREALTRHPWALGLMDSRSNPGPATLRHHDAVLGVLLAGGFSTRGAAHAFSVLDGYIYGFTLQELSLPFDSGPGARETAGAMLEQFPAEEFPHLAAMITEQMLGHDYDYGDEFGIGLDLILDGLRRHRDAWR